MRIAVLGLGSAGRRHALNVLGLGHEAVGFDPQAGDVPGISRVGSADDAVGQADLVVVASPSSLHAKQALLALSAGQHTSGKAPRGDRRGGRPGGRGRRTHRVDLRCRHEPALPPGHPGATGAACDGGARLAAFRPRLVRLRPAALATRNGLPASYSASAALGGGILLDAFTSSTTCSGCSVRSIRVRGTGPGLRAGDRRRGHGAACAPLRLRCPRRGRPQLVEPAYRRGCTLVGSNAVADWDWNAATIRVTGGGDERELDVATDVADTYRAVLEDFIAAADAGRDARTPAADGLAALRVVDAARRSASRGQRVAVS